LRFFQLSLFQQWLSFVFSECTPWTFFHALDKLRKNLRWPETNLKMLFIMHSTCPSRHSKLHSADAVLLFWCSTVISRTSCRTFRVCCSCTFLSTHGLGNPWETAPLWVCVGVYCIPKVEESFRFRFRLALRKSTRATNAQIWVAAMRVLTRLLP